METITNFLSQPINIPLYEILLLLGATMFELWGLYRMGIDNLKRLLNEKANHTQTSTEKELFQKQIEIYEKCMTENIKRMEANINSYKEIAGKMTQSNVTLRGEIKRLREQIGVTIMKSKGCIIDLSSKIIFLDHLLNMAHNEINSLKSSENKLTKKSHRPQGYRARRSRSMRRSSKRI